jgi:hypothetical protein
MTGSLREKLIETFQSAEDADAAILALREWACFHRIFSAISPHPFRNVVAA